jgi:hypothetical protein
MGEAKRRVQYDLTRALPNHVFPEDIPVLFRKTAEELAGAFHDEQLHDARFSSVPAERRRSMAFRAHWPISRTYVKLCWPMFIPMAKTILGDMLTQPGISLTQRDEIYNAFLEMADDHRQLDFSEALASETSH